MGLTLNQPYNILKIVKERELILMRYEVVIMDQGKGKTLVDMELIAESKREVLLILADNLGETLATPSIKISIREI
jgi:hypothetical protein